LNTYCWILSFVNVVVTFRVEGITEKKEEEIDRDREIERD
jgi:hypothetical protein